MKKLIYIIIPFAFAACTSSKPNIEIFQGMMKSPAVKAQGEDIFAPGTNPQLLPPANTVARGHTPYKFADNPGKAMTDLQNPFKGQEETLAQGKKMFDIYCAVCHGATGLGDGPVSTKMTAKVPPLVSPNVKAFSDGYLYHLITMGRGMMGSYAYQVGPEDRWKVINYVRSLNK